MSWRERSTRKSAYCAAPRGEATSSAARASRIAAPLKPAAPSRNARRVSALGWRGERSRKRVTDWIPRRASARLLSAPEYSDENSSRTNASKPPKKSGSGSRSRTSPCASATIESILIVSGSCMTSSYMSFQRPVSSSIMPARSTKARPTWRSRTVKLARE